RGAPRPGDWTHSSSLAGLLTRGSSPGAGLPGCPVAPGGVRLPAHSCGGSHGLGPFWVVRTVFPINPLDLVRRGTIDGPRIAPPAAGGQAIRLARVIARKPDLIVRQSCGSRSAGSAP